MNRTLLVGGLFVSFLGASSPSSAAPLGADAIVKRMLEQDPLGYGGAEAHLSMVLVDQRDAQRRRKLVMYSRNDSRTDRMFVRFSAPVDIAGTAFLSVDRAGNRVQHLHLPALHKTRRISSRQRNSSFVGTDYSYSDLDNRDLKDATKTRLDDDKLGGHDCYVVDAVPTDKRSQYGRVRLWVSKSTWLPLRMRYYDHSDKERKRFTAKEVKRVNGRWIIKESKMVDLKRRRATVLRVIRISLKRDVPLEQFSVRALDRE